MSWINWVDIVVAVIAVMGALAGVRQGFLISLSSFAGLLLGGLAGVRLAPQLVPLVDGSGTRVVLGLGTLMVCIALGEYLGVRIGAWLRVRIGAGRIGGVDKAFGAVLQAGAVLLLSWLVAVTLTAVTLIPGLSSSVRNSAVLSHVDAALPAAAQQVPGDLRRLLVDSGFPDVLGPFSQTPTRQVRAPDTDLQRSELVGKLRPSVLKVRGSASVCSRSLEGSGFVVGPRMVMTNAHVVAGTDDVTVQTAQGRAAATVVLYDARTDVAVLRVPQLRAPVLSLERAPLGSGADAVALGYPLDGPYTASAVRVRDRFTLRGPTIYDSGTVQREVYSVRGQVRSGNSGGPMVDSDGGVRGVVFGAALDAEPTGYVLTADEVADELAEARGNRQEVDTGLCTAG